MNRRTFLLTAGAIAASPSLLLAAGEPYAPGLVRQKLAAGETVFVDFWASWCSTCRAQSRVIEGLRAANPAYDEAISFVQVDWDQYGRGALASALQIPRRSTLVALKGDQEIGRIVAGTSQGDIQRLMDAALAAATA